MIRQSGETGDKPPVTPLSLSPTSRPHFAASFPEKFLNEPPGHPRTFHSPTGDVSPHRVVIGPCARCAVSTAYHCSAQAFPGARPRLKIGCVAPNGCSATRHFIFGLLPRRCSGNRISHRSHCNQTALRSSQSPPQPQTEGCMCDGFPPEGY
jgi:hypothetical protein